MSYDICQIVVDHIANYNKHQTKTFECLFALYPDHSDTIKYEFKRVLDRNFFDFVRDRQKISSALNRFEEYGFVKNRISDIANDYYIAKGRLERKLEQEIFRELYESVCHFELRQNVSLYIKDKYFEESSDRYRFIKNKLDKNIGYFSPFILTGGFPNNVSELESGISGSNQGDGAEHIFVAKAMIAGFIASLVDVRSTGYDAIIEDASKKLLRVQIKSFKGDSFARKGRDRGGQGVDSNDASNAGALVTSDNCDMFVAVNKINGELFIFVREEIDQLPEKLIKRTDYMNNWENWSLINNPQG